MDEIVDDAVASHGSEACREVRNAVADAAHSSRLVEAQDLLAAACVLCGRG